MNLLMMTSKYLPLVLCADGLRVRHGEGRARPHPRGPHGVILPRRDDQVSDVQGGPSGRGGVFVDCCLEIAFN